MTTAADAALMPLIFIFTPTSMGNEEIPNETFDQTTVTTPTSVDANTEQRYRDKWGHAVDSSSVDDTISNPSSTSPATNKATGGDVTAYFNPDGSYVVVDNSTQQVIQVSDRNDPDWVPDNSIKNPPPKNPPPNKP